MLKVNELFSGIGAFRKALINLDVEHEVVGIAEIDKYAIKSYEAMYGQVHNYGDISKSLKLEYADMWTYGFPCQDISVAGKQAGIERHTRSGLLYQVQRLLEVAYQYDELPKYLILENVKNLVGKKFRADFDEWLNYLNELGYNNYWKVLNAKNYGVPQNRERVFVVSIRKDIDTGYEFPMPFDNGIRLKDVLEDEVDEKFYISQEKTEKLISQIKQNNPDIQRRPGEADGVYTNQSLNFTRPPLKDLSRTLKVNVHDAAVVVPIGVALDEQNKCIRKDFTVGTLTTDGSSPKKNNRVIVAVKEATKQGYAIAEEGDSINIAFPNSDTRRGRVGKSVAQTLETSCNQAVLRTVRTEYGKAIRKTYESGEVEESRHNMTQLEPRVDGITNTITTVQKDNLLFDSYRIRKLTPKECFRLMGFSDSDFQKCVDAGISNSQLYKQAGNSIVVDVLFYMLENLLKGGVPHR